MASNMFLYWGSGSIPCWKPMLVLAEKGLDYQQKQISFSQKENKGPDIMKLNPRGQVPTFTDGDICVNESGAICDYLESTYGDKGTRLLPKDPKLRARVQQRMYETPNLQKNVMEAVVYYQFRTKPENVDEEYLNSKKKEAREELQIWEDYLKKEGQGSFLVGTDFTMADVFFFPFIAWCVRGKLNVDNFPCIKAYYDKVVERPSVKETWPPHWKEGEGKGFFVGV